MTEPRSIDQDKLNGLIGQILGDLGGAFSVPLVRMGAELGLYRALNEKGPMTVAQMAAATGCAERYLKEWLSAQAASSYIAYDEGTGTFSLPPEQAMIFAEESSPLYMIGAFDSSVAFLNNQDKVQAAFKSGEGLGWGDQSTCLFCAVARFFRPGYVNNLVSQWLPALDGVVEKLKAGAAVADVGCGHGVSTVLMAQAFPNSTFTGFDFHPNSIAAAKSHADAHDVTNVNFQTGLAKEFPGQYDLVTFFDCLHDMGDPTGAARHVKSALKPGGSWMIVEPMAGDSLTSNLNPVGRLYYSASTMVCVPTSLAQETGLALGAQAGQAKLTEVITAGGFGKVRRATETPFNMVLEARV